MEDCRLEKKILEKMISRLELEDIDMKTEKFNFETAIFSADEEDEQGLGLDSVDALELVVLLNDEFGIWVDLEELEQLKTIRLIADYIREKDVE